MRDFLGWRCAGSLAGMIAGALFVLASLAWAGESAGVLAARADWTCVDVKPAGICRRNTPPFVGIKMSFWQPVLLVETTRQAGRCGIHEFVPLVSALAPSVADKGMFFGSPGQSDTTMLQGHEAHVFGFPFSDALSAAMELPCEGPPDFSGVISYLSEKDAEEWRKAKMEGRHPMSLMTQRSGSMCEQFGAQLPGMCVGYWGALYPRTGYSVHASEVVSSALTAFRAVDIAALKPQTPHRVIAPVLFWPSVRYDRMQLVSPVARRCMAVGENPVLWDRDARSADGRYVWIYWRKKECCLF